MSFDKNKPKPLAPRLHSRNKNRGKYDLAALILASPELQKFIIPNKSGEDSIDFSNPAAVKALNKALLASHYDVHFWEFPDENLCPPIPGRADYIHHIADLLAGVNADIIPTGPQITCLDIGVGASCIYPIIGVVEYGWQFIGSDINPKSIEAAQQIMESNPNLKGKITCKLQSDPDLIFQGIVDEGEKIDVTICNPPFHSTSEDASKSSRRKVRNLIGKKVKNPTLNFSGRRNELVYEGGERRFIHNMINESKMFSNNCLWFTTLVSKESNLKGIYHALNALKASEIKTIPMRTGNKSSRIVAWTFKNENEQKEWIKKSN